MYGPYILFGISKYLIHELKDVYFYSDMKISELLDLTVHVLLKRTLSDRSDVRRHSDKLVSFSLIFMA